MACYCRNIEIGPLGFSPQQIKFGVGTHIPGITDGNIATDSEITDSEAIREHFQLIFDARRTYLEADSSQRIKKALKSQVPSFNDLVFYPGEKVFFRNEKEVWDGPAVVVTSEGRTVWYRWYGILRKAATNRLLKHHDETIEREDQKEEANDSDSDKIEVVEDITESSRIENATENTPSLACDKCEYKSSDRELLEDHIKINHEDFLYACDLCEYKSNQKNTLKSHVETVHEEFLYSCDQCEYKSNKKEVLINHNKSSHKDNEAEIDEQNLEHEEVESIPLKSSLRKK